MFPAVLPGLSNTSEVTGDEGDTSKVNHDEDIDSFFQLADQLVQLENKPRNSTALERQVRQLTVIFQSLPLSHQKRALLHLAETLKVDPIQVRKKSEDLLRVQTSDASAFAKASEDLRSSLTPPYRYSLNPHRVACAGYFFSEEISHSVANLEHITT